MKHVRDAVILAGALAGLVMLFGDSNAGEVKPLIDPSRASLAAGLDYASYSDHGSQLLPKYSKSFEVSVLGAYVLTPHLTLTGSAAYDVDNKFIRWRGGIRTVIWKGGAK